MVELSTVSRKKSVISVELVLRYCHLAEPSIPVSVSDMRRFVRSSTLSSLPVRRCLRSSSVSWVAA